MSATTGGRVEKVGVEGEINGYDVLVLGDAVIVGRGGATVAKRTVPGLGRFVDGARDLKLGWGAKSDFEILYLCDAADWGFGYALNLADEWLSEWGYSSWPSSASTRARPYDAARSVRIDECPQVAEDTSTSPTTEPPD